MTNITTTWTQATIDDADTILTLMREFYVEERLEFNESSIVPAVSDLLSNPTVGVMFLLKSENGDFQGYLVASFGYSLEFGGRFVLLDELYVHPAARGRGESKRALSLLEQWATEQGVLTTRLEVNDHNDKARAIYLKSGYISHSRDILTKWLIDK